MKDSFIDIKSEVSKHNEEKFRFLFDKMTNGFSLLDLELDEIGQPVDIERNKAVEAMKTSEARFQKLLNSVTDYVYKVYINDNKDIETIHGAGCISITGYSVNEFNKNNLLWFAIVHDDDKELVKNCIDKLQINEEQAPFEHRIIHKNGTIRWIRNTIVLRRNDEGKLVGYDGLISDITKNKVLEQLLLNSVIDTEERERSHFSQELHDGIGPLLSSIKILVQWLAKPDANIVQSEVLREIEILLDESLSTIRDISFKLSPHILQNYGIEEAIKAFIDKVKDISLINIEIIAKDICRFHEKVETITYRVLCECINNTIKHANAQQMLINLRCYNNVLFAECYDDGKGFDVEKVMSDHKGIGLLNIRSRIKSINGSIDIWSEPGKGSTIKFQIKLHIAEKYFTN